MRIDKKTADSSDKLISGYIKMMKLAPALNTRRVFMAWMENSGAAAYTIKQFYRNGTLTVTLNSSMIRTVVGSRLDEIIERINCQLKEDELFTDDDPKVGYVQKIVLK